LFCAWLLRHCLHYIRLSRAWLIHHCFLYALYIIVLCLTCTPLFLCLVLDLYVIVYIIYTPLSCAWRVCHCFLYVLYTIVLCLTPLFPLYTFVLTGTPLFLYALFTIVSCLTGTPLLSVCTVYLSRDWL
jgi:hypothetical protein